MQHRTSQKIPGHLYFSVQRWYPDPVKILSSKWRTDDYYISHHVSMIWQYMAILMAVHYDIRYAESMDEYIHVFMIWQFMAIIMAMHESTEEYIQFHITLPWSASLAMWQSDWQCIKISDMQKVSTDEYFRLHVTFSWSGNVWQSVWQCMKHFLATDDPLLGSDD